ncbi:MAG: membrane protein insertase YidC [Desulfobacterales bacterium]
MEQARVIIAIVLSFLIFIVWEVFFVDRQELQRPSPVTQTSEQKSEDVEKKIIYTPQIEEDLKARKGEITRPSDYQIRETNIETPLYTVTISEQGATFKNFILKDYKESTGENAPSKELISKAVENGALQSSFENNSIQGLNDAIFESAVAGKSIDVYNEPKTVVFKWISPDGVVFEKEYLFSPETYLISMVIRIKNGSEKDIVDQLKITLVNQLETKDAYYGFVGPSGLIDNKVKEVKIDDIKNEPISTGTIKWIGLETIYFMNSVVPKELKNAEMLLKETEDRIVYNSYREPITNMQRGTESTFSYDIFFGPKSIKLLSQMNNGLDKSIKFGIFDFIAKPCLWLMNFIHDYIPNYGIAIIILTIIVKIILWPLGNKSYKSMNEMKKLAPLMNEIKEKYKDDKKKMNQEVMGLYKTYKVNPMGGCLPMVLQIPVFFALYRMLYEAIELRHAPFVLWINDLSAPDRLFDLDIYIPFMQPPFGIPVLTLIMGASMFFQQKMAPAPADPTQAKLMMFMPILFTVIFVNFSSGLVLYWLVNNLLSMGQQYYVSKKKG